MLNRRKFILLIEDNPDDADLTKRAFSRHEFDSEIFHVTSGHEALDFLFARDNYANRDGEALPAVVLLDLKLPQLNGLEVLKEIRNAEKTRNIPVVVLTSSNDHRDIAESYALGANSYVRKSIDYTEFSDAIRELGNYWLALNVEPATNHLSGCRP